MYKKETSPGVFVKRYKAIADAVNEYTGKRVQKQQSGFTSIPKAQRRERELWLECKKGHPVLPKNRFWKVLHEHYTESCYRKIRNDDNPNGISAKTYWSKRNCFKHLDQVMSEKYREKGLLKWDDLHIEIITPHFLNDELDELIKAKKVSAWTALKIQKEVKAAMSYALQIGFLKVNHLDGMKKRRVPKKRKVALNHEEANKLLFEAKKQNHPYYLVWLLSMFLGCRRSELAGLKWTDIDFNSRLVFIERQKIPGEGIVPYPKNKEPRPVPLHKDLVPILKEHKLKAMTDFVIELNDSRWNWGSQSEVIKEFCEQIGIKKITHHQLRNTFIMLSLADDVALAFVKESVGHSKLSTTDEYYTASGLNLTGKTDKLNIKIPSASPGEVFDLKSKRERLKKLN